MFQCNYVTTLYSVLNNFRRSLRSRPHLDRVSSVAFFDARFACGQLLYQFNLVLLALFVKGVHFTFSVLGHFLQETRRGEETNRGEERRRGEEEKRRRGEEERHCLL